MLKRLVAIFGENEAQPWWLDVRNSGGYDQAYAVCIDWIYILRVESSQSGAPRAEPQVAAGEENTLARSGRRTEETTPEPARTIRQVMAKSRWWLKEKELTIEEDWSEEHVNEGAREQCPEVQNKKTHLEVNDERWKTRKFETREGWMYTLVETREPPSA